MQREHERSGQKTEEAVKPETGEKYG